MNSSRRRTRWPAPVTSNQDLSRRTGYIYQYNFTIQHQLRPNLLLETGYLGNTGQKQVGTVWVNQPRLPENPAAPTPFAAEIALSESKPGVQPEHELSVVELQRGIRKARAASVGWTLLQRRLHLLQSYR